MEAITKLMTLLDDNKEHLTDGVYLKAVDVLMEEREKLLSNMLHDDFSKFVQNLLEKSLRDPSSDFCKSIMIAKMTSPSLEQTKTLYANMIVDEFIDKIDSKDIKSYISKNIKMQNYLELKESLELSNYISSYKSILKYAVFKVIQDKIDYYEEIFFRFMFVGLRYHTR